MPVELGKRYTDEDWLQKLMNFHDYLAEYVFGEKKVMNIYFTVAFDLVWRLFVLRF
jgi:hypothetical protein